MTSHAPSPTRRKTPPSWWWLLGPALLMFAAVLVGGGAFVATLSEIDTRYGEVPADGEPHEVSVPAGQRALVMTSANVNRFEWECRVTDEQGTELQTDRPNGTVSLGSESASWESQLAFDAPAAAGGDEVTVDVACRAEGETGHTVLVTKAPTAGAMVVRIGLMVLGPIVLGGIGFVWFVILLVLQVVRRSEAA